MTDKRGEWPQDIDEVIRHLGSVEIDLDGYEVEVESCRPTEGLPYGEFAASLSRTLDLDDHPRLREAVDRLVAEVAAIFREGDPEYRPDRCDRCVNSDCCHMGRIFLSREEALAILAHLGEKEETFSRYFEREKDIAGAYDYIFRHRDGHCPFLIAQGDRMRCSVYSVRPRVCREFDAASCDECEEELEE